MQTSIIRHGVGWQQAVNKMLEVSVISIFLTRIASLYYRLSSVLKGLGVL